ncbi:DR2241 family protein [Haloferula sp.]|uniref:DR2241 family protein n=1 Tax=Haloferula sp. TaxID=2497595 RepID=UPI003C782160
MIAEQLEKAVNEGIRQIGQVAILTDVLGSPFGLCHLDDQDSIESLEIHRGPATAREISTWAADGHYRFTKGELSLKDGWLLLLSDIHELRQALDLLYPASVGLWLAEQAGELDVEHLRDKLNRQTGMYKFAKNISDAGAQKLVQKVCGPSNCCVKDIRWQIDAETPLEESEASRYNGIVGDTEKAIPLFCREACNHFVAEARKASKAEFEAAAKD